MNRLAARDAVKDVAGSGGSFWSVPEGGCMAETAILARRRKWAAEKKVALLAEVDAESGRVAMAARRHGLSGCTRSFARQGRALGRTQHQDRYRLAERRAVCWSMVRWARRRCHGCLRAVKGTL
jgi:hypothetical protein